MFWPMHGTGMEFVSDLVIGGMEILFLCLVYDNLTMWGTTPCNSCDGEWTWPSNRSMTLLQLLLTIQPFQIPCH